MAYRHKKTGEAEPEKFEGKFLFNKDELGKKTNVVKLAQEIQNNSGTQLNVQVVTLTPSTDYGASSVSRLKKFYKQFGFVENKGRNKDYEISEAMYRLPKASKFIERTGIMANATQIINDIFKAVLGGERPGHKYKYRKKGKGGEWQYFYDEPKKLTPAQVKARQEKAREDIQKKRAKEQKKKEREMKPAPLKVMEEEQAARTKTEKMRQLNYNEKQKLVTRPDVMQYADRTAKRFGNAYRYLWGNAITDDAMKSAAYMGLVRAAETFDPNRDTDFKTHAHNYIKNE
jgi:hypothetical protein